MRGDVAILLCKQAKSGVDKTCLGNANLKKEGDAEDFELMVHKEKNPAKSRGVYRSDLVVYLDQKLSLFEVILANVKFSNVFWSVPEIILYIDFRQQSRILVGSDR